MLYTDIKGEWVLAATDKLTNCDIKVVVYFSLEVHGNCTTNINDALYFATSDEAEALKKLLTLSDNFIAQKTIVSKNVLGEK